jgi:release factor glutamine methyltransferase
MIDYRADAIRRLTEAGVGNPRLDTRLMWDQAQHNPGQFEALVKRRLAREPLAYITGLKEFWSLEFEVAPGVLIPRPETETIVEQVLEHFPASNAPLKLLDLGTGSGCLLTALLKEFPNATGLGIDESEQALIIAARNLNRHGLQARAELCRGNWLEGLTGPFDVIVSNPPYIPTADIAGLEPDVRDHEPLGALDGGPDGLDAVRALAAAFARLAAGKAFVEIGAGQGDAAAVLFRDAGLEVVHIAPDLAAIPRVVVVNLAAAARVPAKKELE